jgi:glucosylceramidase
MMRWRDVVRPGRAGALAGAAWLVITAAHAAGGPQRGVSAASPVPDGATVRAGHVAAWLTTADRSSVLARQPDVALGAPPRVLTPWSPGVETAAALPAGPHSIMVDVAHPAQPVLGFGATLSDASAWLLQRLDTASRAALLDDLFSRTGNGLGLGFVRLYLGASEFARSRYSNGDTADGGDDPGLTQVSLTAERELVIPLALEAMARNPALEFVGSPTSAPAWMKTNGSLVQGALKPEAYGAYARYLQRIVGLYLEEGIPLYALTMQNDPQAQPADAPGMLLDAKARAELAGKHLGPLLQEGGPRLLEWDGDWDGAADARKVMTDKAAAPYLAGVAWHCHGGVPAAQGALRAELPASEAYITECSGGSWAPEWGDNLLYFARVLAGGVRHGARGIALGNVALDEQGGPRTGGCRGCRGVVTIGAGGVVRNPEYYALAHLSRWVLPGARALPAGEGRDGVEQAAFINPDGSMVLVAVNSAPQARAVTVKAADKGFGYTLPAGSVATLVWGP